jgi:8-oxo-dGTP pyrophosphatase MutT (NUDIX family)
MSNSRKSVTAKRVQYAALPYRMNGRTRPEVMLVTSRETRRWIIPKGWPHKGKAPHRSAAREAFEEAGVIGAVNRQSVGSFSYEKRLKKGGVVACEVLVFALEVKRQSKEWPEKRERKVRWLSARVAAKTVQDRELGKIIRRLARRSRPRT